MGTPQIPTYINESRITAQARFFLQILQLPTQAIQNLRKITRKYSNIQPSNHHPLPLTSNKAPPQKRLRNACSKANKQIEYNSKEKGSWRTWYDGQKALPALRPGAQKHFLP